MLANRGYIAPASMPTLSSSIVKNRVASMRDVEEALARQVLYGGDLATNLLELAAVSEADLTGLLAESHGLEPAAVGELPTAPDSVLRLVPGELAQRHAFYPVSEQDGLLVIAVSDPLPPEVDEDLCFALSVRLEQRAAPVVRIRQAIARDYGLPLDRRTLRLVAKLEGRPDPSPSSLPGPVRPGMEGPSLPRPASVPPMIYPPETSLAPPGQRATPPPPPPPEPEPKPAPEPPEPEPLQEPEEPAVASEPTSSEPVTAKRLPSPTPVAPPTRVDGARRRSSSATLRSSLAGVAGRSEQGRRRHRGPYTAAMAEKDLMDAASRDDVLRAFFDFASQYFEYSALFAVHGDIAEGRDAHGPGRSAEQINRIGVPLDLPGALASARQERSFCLHRLEDDGLDASLAKDLERPTGKQVLLLPVMVRGRCVLILYGDHGDADVSLSDVGDVIAFASLVAAGLERVILRSKLAARQALADDRGTPLPPLAARPQRRARLPPREERARALAAVLDGAAPASVAPRTAQASPAANLADAPVTRAASPGAKAASTVPAKRVEARAVPVPRPSPAQHDERGSAPKADAVRTVVSAGAPARRRVSTPPQGTPLRLDPEVSGEAQPFPLTRRTPRPSTADGEEPPEDGWEPPLATEASFGSASHPPARRAPTEPGLGEQPASSRRGGTARLELVDRHEEEDTSIEIGESSVFDDDVMDALAREEEAPLAPSSRSVAYGPRRLRPRQSAKDLALPSVIIDLESDCSTLVDRLVNGDADAADKLIEIGEPAVSVLVSRFPGPIDMDARRLASGTTRASECGPLLAVIGAIGSSATPFLVVRTADADPEVRAWATRLLGEMPSMESARAVARRFLDSDENVRRAALSAARMLQEDDESRAALRDGLAIVAADGAQSNDARLAAIEGLADVRDQRAIPRLIPLLPDTNAEVAKSAHWALVVLTRQDCGKDPRAWNDWWRENGSRHRFEWLIDALMNDDAAIRRAAGDELKTATKEYFGYYDDLPKKERAKAQNKYRQWWDAKGKARFR